MEKKKKIERSRESTKKNRKVHIKSEGKSKQYLDRWKNRKIHIKSEGIEE